MTKVGNISSESSDDEGSTAQPSIKRTAPTSKGKPIRTRSIKEATSAAPKSSIMGGNTKSQSKTVSFQFGGDLSSESSDDEESAVPRLQRKDNSNSSKKKVIIDSEEQAARAIEKKEKRKKRRREEMGEELSVEKANIQGDDEKHSESEADGAPATESKSIGDRTESTPASQKKEKKPKKAKTAEKKGPGRPYTVSMAVPGSVISNAQTRELKTYLAGQIARSAAVFCVDEVIIFDDMLSKTNANTDKNQPNPCVFLARLLQYLETPQYLRKHLFPVHPDLKFAGLLNPLDAPHHVRKEEWSEYREGVVVKDNNSGHSGSQVHVGLRRDVNISQKLKEGTRVTIKLQKGSDRGNGLMSGVAVSPNEPREKTGKYWGYTTRLADSLGHVWTDCPYPGGYDVAIGTSERGHISVDDPSFKIPSFKHLLIVFGGPAGIEECVAADESLQVSAEQSHSLFDIWVNTCPIQGSRTIRSEEAVLISMSSFRPHIMNNSLP